MLLELSRGGAVQNPSDTQIEQALQSLLKESSATASLTRSATSYIEATGSVSEGFALEYRTSSTYYRSANTALGVGDVINAFQAFGRGDAQYLRQLLWEQERPVIRYGSLLLGGVLLFAGTVLHLRLVQAVGMALEAFAVVLWTWMGLRSGEIHVRGTLCRRARAPLWYWVLVLLQVSAAAVAVWLTAALLRGSVTVP